MKALSDDQYGGAEARMRELLAQGGLPAPDECEHDQEARAVRFLWHDRKVCVVIELDEEPSA